MKEFVVYGLWFVVISGLYKGLTIAYFRKFKRLAGLLFVVCSLWLFTDFVKVYNSLLREIKADKYS